MTPDLTGLRWQAEDPLADSVMMIDPTYDQVAWRFRNDDGNEANATWMEVQNLSPGDIAPTKIFRLRFEIQETAGGSANNRTIVLQYDVNGGGWNNIDQSSSFIRLHDSPNVANGTPTTDQLTGGTGTFLPGIVATTTSGTDISFSGNEHTEVEWCLEMVQGDINELDDVSFRVTIQGALPHASTAGNPTITVWDPIRAVTPNDVSIATNLLEPALSQVQMLSPESVDISTAISEPVSTTVINLSSVDLEISQEILDPSITQIHMLGADDLAVSAEIPDPLITQIHELDAQSAEITTHLESPSLGAIGFVEPHDVAIATSLLQTTLKTDRAMRLLPNGAMEAQEIRESTGALLKLDPTGAFVSTGGEFIEVESSSFSLRNDDGHVMSHEFIEV